MNVTKLKIYDLKTDSIKSVDLMKKPINFMTLIRNEGFDYHELINDKNDAIKNL
jgi:hypothetical protein